MKKEHCTAIVLAGGSGKRMGTNVHKQYLLIGGRPVLYYSLKAFQDSELIHEIILVTGKGEETYCRTEIVEKYQLDKVKKITAGGKERYESVWNGLCESSGEGLVFIHDGARPFVDRDMIRRGYECVTRMKACAAGMPVKDTIKITDEQGIVEETPDRSSLWAVQTPQVFQTRLIKQAYAMLMESGNDLVTDDAMVAEQMLGIPVQMYRGSYENIKITTPEDLAVAEVFLKNRNKC